jgi:hypothetical protein
MATGSYLVTSSLASGLAASGWRSLLPARQRDPVHRLAGERQPQAEQEALDVRPGQPDHDLAEVDFRLVARAVRLRHEDLGRRPNNPQDYGIRGAPVILRPSPRRTGRVAALAGPRAAAVRLAANTAGAAETCRFHDAGGML